MHYSSHGCFYLTHSVHLLNCHILFFIMCATTTSIKVMGRKQVIEEKGIHEKGSSGEVQLALGISTRN